VLLAEAAFDEIAATVFIDVALIVVVARLMGRLFRKIRQPAVVGEILAGIALGPSLLGLLPGEWFGLSTSVPQWLFPLEVRPFLKILAELGLIIFMFIVGLELDPKLIRGRERIAAVISLSSIVVPFGMGMLLATVLYGTHEIVNGKTVEFMPFALFIGASMSITAFPVLARILGERGMHRTPVGALALASAAVDDILAWSMLALVVAVVQSSGGAGGLGSLARILGESILYVAVMFGVVRPLLARIVPRYREAGRLTPDILAIVIIGFLVSSFITSKIGIHSIFGAFVFGAIMPREGVGDLVHDILERLEQVSVLLLLPVFFITTGLNADVSGIGGSGLVELGLVMLAACSGKFIGAMSASRVQGLSWRRSATIGTLMNTRGLTELVILNIGLSVGVLDKQLFTILVCMAILTTVMTEPLLRVFYPDRQVKADIAEAERAGLGEPGAFRVVVSVGDLDPPAAANLVDLAIALIGDEQPAELVLSRFQAQHARLEVGTGLVGELGSFAESLGAVQTLTKRVEDAGVVCIARSQFSADPLADLLAQAAAVDADIVILAESAAVTAGTLEPDPASDEERRFLTIVVRGAEHGLPASADRSIELVGGVAPEAAAEVAVRLARSQHLPVLVHASVGGRREAKRLDQAIDRFRAFLPTATPDRPSLVGVTVTDIASDDTPVAVEVLTLVVHGTAVSPDRLSALAQRLERAKTESS